MGKRSNLMKKHEKDAPVLTADDVREVSDEAGEIRVDEEDGASVENASTDTQPMSADVSLAAADIDQAVAEIETRNARDEAYAAQPAETVAIGSAAPSLGAAEETVGADEQTAEITTTETKAAARASKRREPRATLITHKASDMIVRALGANREAFFQLDSSLSSDSGDVTAREATTLAAIDGLDKKTREKAVNLFKALATGKTPSVYTRVAIKQLQERGSLALKDLVAIYQTEHHYKIGTARRQASEMFALLPLVGIAKRASARGAPLAFNENSTLVNKVVMSGSSR